MGEPPEHRARILEQVEKLIVSEELRGSESLSNLLRFLARHALEHPGDPPKEHQIATEVFRRPADFDPRLDSCVRVQTGRLRGKLSDYYAGPGAGDRVVIEIPKGSYTLSFRVREGKDATPPAAPAEAAQAAAAAPQRRALAARLFPRWSRPVAILIAGGAIGFALAGITLRSRTVKPSRAVGAFWNAFISAPQPPLVIFSNAEFVGRPATGMRYFNPATDSGQAILDHYTGVGEVLAVHDLDQLFSRFNREIRVKRGRLLTWDDAKNRDLVFIGSTAENLSLRELPTPQDLIFKVRETPPRQGDLAIVNLHPNPGEQAFYVGSETWPPREDYALVARLPGLSPNNTALILAGITTLGTHAAVEFVCRTAALESLLAKLTGSPYGDPLPFEAVIRVRISGGVPVESQLVAVHPRNSRSRTNP